MTFRPNLMPPVTLSPTLAADELVKQLRAQQRPIRHMGFGQAPFPAPSRMVNALAAAADQTSYLPVAGLPDLRQAIGRHQSRLLGTDPEAIDVIVAPGSKLIIYAVQMAVEGDLLLPTPSWVSYAPQAKMLGQSVIPVPTSLTAAGIDISAEDLEQTISHARSQGLRPTKILLNYPNNPTGLTLSNSVMKAIAEICVRENIVIIADEIYGRLAFDGVYRSISTYAPENTVVTTGLSKHLSLGGWRVGAGTVPKSIPGLFDALTGIASETWSCAAAPVQIASIDGYDGHEDIETFIADSTQIHRTVTRYVADQLTALGAPAFQPQGGFYVWPDFETARVTAAIGTSDQLSTVLIERYGLVTLPGSAFGEHPSKLNLRLSTCDYDGAIAMDVLHQRGADFFASDVPTFAPNVVAALESVAAFLTEVDAG